MKSQVKDGYTDTAYHSFKHGADVAQMMHLMVNNHLGSGTPYSLDSTEPFKLLIISLCHDIGIILVKHLR